MEFCNSVYGVASGDCQVSHAHGFDGLLFNEGKDFDSLFVFWVFALHLVDEFLIDIINDLQMPGEHAVKQFHRPFFQGFGQDGVNKAEGIIPAGEICSERSAPGMIPSALFTL